MARINPAFAGSFSDIATAAAVIEIIDIILQERSPAAARLSRSNRSRLKAVECLQLADNARHSQIRSIYERLAACPIAYLGKEVGGQLSFAGTAFLTLSGAARNDLEQRIKKLVTERPPVPQRVWRQPQWLKPELRVRVKHLAGGDTLRHATVKGLAG